MDLFQSIVLNGQFDGRAICPAGMNVLHYAVLQPALLTGTTNTMLKLLNLALKLGPDVNRQVCALELFGCCKVAVWFLCY
jgi:hypothetical protein